MNLHTGGISCGVNAYESLKEPGTYQAMFEIRCKALYEELPKAFSMMEEMMMTSRLRDRKRLTEISAETRSRHYGPCLISRKVPASQIRPEA